MSLFSWFSNKRAEPESSLPSDSGVAPATVPARPGRHDEGAHGAPGHKHERGERREALYGVVTETMTQVGVLSSSYKFKVLSLDPQGHEFVVMMDVPLEQARDAGRLAEVEALIARNAKARHALLVTAVYWRVNDHVTAGVTPQSLAQPQTRSAPPKAEPTPVAAPAAVPVAAAAAVAADGALADEILAFRKSMAEGNRAAPKVARDQSPSDFADTVIQDIGPGDDLR